MRLASAKGYRRNAVTPCVTGCPRSACKTTERHVLASGGVARRPVSIKNPTGNNHRRHHMCRIATITLPPQPTQAQHGRCCGWQIRFGSGGNIGGESKVRERQQPIQQRAVSKCSSWFAPLLSELCGCPLTVVLFVAVAAAHTCRSAITSAGASCGERWPEAIGTTG